MKKYLEYDLNELYALRQELIQDTIRPDLESEQGAKGNSHGYTRSVLRNKPDSLGMDIADPAPNSP
jgi:hypothetical protein